MTRRVLIYVVTLFVASLVSFKNLFPKPTSKFRRTEKLVGGSGGKFVDFEFDDLKKGDNFRMFEPDGTPVEYGDIFVALSDAYDNGRSEISVL